MSRLCIAETVNNIDEIQNLLSELEYETRSIQIKYKNLNSGIAIELNDILKRLKVKRSLRKQLQLMLKKEQLKETLQSNILAEASDISKIRYLKGLQIIKILYEKTLSLDHHFASVITFSEINKLSNPNHYSEFTKLKEIIGKNQEKKMGFGLSEILSENIYTSVFHSFVSLFTNKSTSKKDKETSLKNVECILDFTLRMHNDLNTIYFETAFLQKSNENVIKELEKLFVDYTKPIKYRTPLKECRNADDWDKVQDDLNRFLERLNDVINDESQRYKAHKMQINLEFPIERLLQFITLYNSHINQGAKFYEKFSIMLDSYENESYCESKIPNSYKALKENIKISISKFNTAYKPAEINGSKMKQVLYGISEYD